MSKVILNTSKKLEIISDGGRYKLIAKMKVEVKQASDKEVDDVFKNLGL